MVDTAFESAAILVRVFLHLKRCDNLTIQIPEHSKGTRILVAFVPNIFWKNVWTATSMVRIAFLVGH